MTSDAANNKLLKLLKSLKVAFKAFEGHNIFLDEIRIDYSCAGGSCDMCFAYLASEQILVDHEVARYVSKSLSIPADLIQHESDLKTHTGELLYALHGSSAFAEAGSSGYFHTRASCSLITGQHFQSEIEGEEDGECQSEYKQVYLFCIKTDAFEDDWEIIDIQVPNH